MELLIIFAIIAFVGFVLVFHFDELDGLWFFGFMVGMMGAVLLFTSILTIPINRMSVHSDIAEFKEVRATAERMRDRGDTWESAAFQTKVADRNAWLASTRYYNDTVFDLWIPDSVENLGPIE